MNRMKNEFLMFEKISKYFKKEYWSLKDNPKSKRRRMLIKQLRIIMLAYKGFTEDRVQVRASALTYYTILSIVPIAAMVFGIAKAFGFDERLQSTLKVEGVEGQSEIAAEGQNTIAPYILEFAETYITNIKGGVIAGIGVILLLWTVMRLLSNIELSFNDIWQIKKSRAMSRKMSDYISLVVIGPILVAASSSINIFLEQQVESSSEALPLLGYIGGVLSVLLKVVPFIFIWLVFMLVYIIMPNTRVKAGSALVGGIVGGTLFQIFQLIYINFQSQLFNYGEVYGSFAALPLFLVWMQISWLIVLFGAEIAFANQNLGHYEAESESYNISHHMKLTVTLLIVRQIALTFRNSEPPLTSEDIADKLDLPVRLVRDILYELSEVGIVSETVTRNVKQHAYQPGTDTDKLTVSFVIDSMERRGNDSISTDNIKDVKKMVELMDGFSSEIEKSKNNKLLVDL